MFYISEDFRKKNSLFDIFISNYSKCPSVIARGESADFVLEVTEKEILDCILGFETTFEEIIKDFHNLYGEGNIKIKFGVINYFN